MKCPKCGYERLATDSAPEWQCPSCQVAYMKARSMASPSPAHAPSRGQKPTTSDAKIAIDGDSESRVALAAQGQRTVIYSIVLNFVVRAMAQGNSIAPWVAALLTAAVAAYSLLGVLRICSALGATQNRKLTFMALSFVPLVNLVALVILNARATRLLRAAGWRVGLLGARP